MSVTVEAVRLAINAVADAKPTERRQRFTALVTARKELATWVGRCETWLNDEMRRLDESPHDSTYERDNARWMKRKVIYEEAFNVLQDALLMEKHLTMGPPPRVQQPFGDLGEPPF